MAGAQPREATPPPVIGKAGRYTVFITPPPTPRPSEGPKICNPSPIASPKLKACGVASPRNAPPFSAKAPPSPSPPPFSVKAPPSPPPKPVQVPPAQFEKPKIRRPGSGFGFFWDAVAKVQDAHSSLDEYVAYWFGLDQSKYQWALDYYENNGVDKEGGKPKEPVTKRQDV